MLYELLVFFFFPFKFLKGVKDGVCTFYEFCNSLCVRISRKEY